VNGDPDGGNARQINLIQVLNVGGSIVPGSAAGTIRFLDNAQYLVMMGGIIYASGTAPSIAQLGIYIDEAGYIGISQTVPPNTYATFSKTFLFTSLATNPNEIEFNLANDALTPAARVTITNSYFVVVRL
jgi:hypothetical protein